MFSSEGSSVSSVLVVICCSQIIQQHIHSVPVLMIHLVWKVAMVQGEFKSVIVACLPATSKGYRLAPARRVLHRKACGDTDHILTFKAELLSEHLYRSWA